MQTHISLAVIPTRIFSLEKTIASLRNQTVQADRIFVNYCNHYNRLNTDLSSKGRKILYDIAEKYNCELRCVKDLGPCSKFYGVADLVDKKDRIILVDDDIAASDIFIKTITEQHIPGGEAIGGMGVKFIDSHDIKYETAKNTLGLCNFLKTVYGSLYEPHHLKLAEKLILICPNHMNDDIIIGAALAKAGIKKLSLNIPFLLGLESSKINALHLTSNRDNSNSNKLIDVFREDFKREIDAIHEWQKPS